jgi:site-specific DNA-adenine methylase
MQNKKLDRFIINYNGNKYNETKKYLSDIDISEYDIIAEPFCGIFGFSRKMYELYPDFKGEIWLNDFDSDLIKIIKQLKTNPLKFIKNVENQIKKYEGVDMAMTKDKTKSYEVSYIFRTFTRHLMSINLGEKKIRNYKEKLDIYEDFFKNVKLFNLDYIKFLDELPKNKKVLIFFDPPYIDSNNKGYQKFEGDTVDRKEFYDPSTTFIKIKDYFDNKNFDCLAIFNYLGLLDYFYKEYKTEEIKSRYGAGNYKYHVIYKNFT